MKLSVKSLKGVEFEGGAVSLNIKTASGEITVLDHHRPLVTLLAKGEAVIKTPGDGEKRVAVDGGFLEVEDTNSVTVLID